MQEIHIMSTYARLAANLSNALKSTGPNTKHGKERSKLNAVRHGLTAQTILLPNEDALAYKALCDEFTKHCRPANILEKVVVQQIADSAWRLGRCTAMSENMFSAGHMTADGNMLMPDPSLHAAITAPRVLKNNVPSLEALSRATSRLQRGLKEAMDQLLALQTERKLLEKATLEAASAMAKYLKSIQRTFVPADFGFVLTIEKIDAHIRYESMLETALSHQKRLPKAA